MAMHFPKIMAVLVVGPMSEVQDTRSRIQDPDFRIQEPVPKIEDEQSRIRAKCCYNCSAVSFVRSVVRSLVHSLTL